MKALPVALLFVPLDTFDVVHDLLCRERLSQAPTTRSAWTWQIWPGWFGLLSHSATQLTFFFSKTYTSNIYEPQFLKLRYPCFSHYYISHFTLELACIIIKKIQFLKLLCLPLLFQLLGATTLLTKHSVNISVVLNKITCHQSILFFMRMQVPS
jgi:hypothetical protein